MFLEVANLRIGLVAKTAGMRFPFVMNSEVVLQVARLVKNSSAPGVSTAVLHLGLGVTGCYHLLHRVPLGRHICKGRRRIFLNDGLVITLRGLNDGLDLLALRSHFGRRQYLQILRSFILQGSALCIAAIRRVFALLIG